MLRNIDLLFLHLRQSSVYFVLIRDQGGIKREAGTGEPGSSIAKDLINSEDPKHTLFCRETAFVAIYALFKG